MDAQPEHHRCPVWRSFEIMETTPGDDGVNDRGV
jgi:hypothetical protein